MAFQRWIGFVAVRYFRGRRRNRSSPAPVLGILGIATGVLALTVIIAVMNGFQLGFIESILEISSYHLRVESFPPGERGEELRAKILELPSIKSAVPFREVQGLARGSRPGQRGVVARGLGPEALDQDPGMASKLAVEAGSFDLGDEADIVLGAELARRLEARVGDWITLVSVSGDLFAPEGEENSRFCVAGIFRSDFYEYDLGWAFININRAGILNGAAPGSPGEAENPSLGIKMKNRWQDRTGMDQLRKLLEEQGQGGLKISSWRDYNRAFFGALRTEKLFMFILVGLIFIVVGLNIFQAQRRSVLERREEIGLLRAMGATDMAVRLVFVWDGVIIGGLGAGSGMILGLLIAFNIQAFFTLLEGTVNFFIHLLNLVSSIFIGGGGVAGEGFAIFSPTIFYIKTIPSRLIPHEVLLIFLFGFLSALLSAWFASGRVSRTRPAEVLRYE
jgi:lipoprotein-releasing system permease protein